MQWLRLAVCVCGCAVAAASGGEGPRVAVGEAPESARSNPERGPAEHNVPPTVDQPTLWPEVMQAADGELPVDELPPVAPVSLPTREGAPTDEANADTGSPESSAGVGDESVAYSNTPPPTLYLPPGPGRLIADDIHTVAIGGCNLTGYEFVVRRSAGECDGLGTIYCDADEDCPEGQACAPWDEPGFRVEYALWDGCPGAGGEIIPGTDGFVDLPGSGVYTVAVTPAEPVAPGQSYWVSTRFDQPGAGWTIGTQAFVGYTRDVYDFGLPGFFCDARTGDAAIHAGFHFRAFCEPPFEREFFAYYNGELDGPTHRPGANQWLVDDVELAVTDCVLSSLEIGTVAAHELAPFPVEAEIWRDCDPATAVAGTYASAQGNAIVGPQVVRFDYPGGVPLPPNLPRLWVAWRYSDASSALIAGRAELGFTDNSFRMSDGGQCDWFWFGGWPWGGFMLNISCLGDPPQGACCDLGQSGEAPTCQVVPETLCSGDDIRWRRDATCETDGLDPPCGTSACCLPEPLPFGSCENLLQPECEARGGVWQRARFCGLEDQACVPFVCRGAGGDCTMEHEGAGCADTDCCAEVCEFDEWCCTVEWDAVCAHLARDACTVAPFYDVCADPEGGERGALLVEANSSTLITNRRARTQAEDTASECEPVGGLGWGTVWFKFIATDHSARIETCRRPDEEPVGENAILEVYGVGDPSTPQTACESLNPKICNHRANDCGDDNARIDVFTLEPGSLYYIRLESLRPSDRGTYLLTLTSPSPAPVTDCNDNGRVDAEDIACGAGNTCGGIAGSGDCNENAVPDDCDIASGHSTDENGNGVPEECELCRDGEIVFVDPPSGWHDARQPLPLYFTGWQGVRSLVVRAPHGADYENGACWSLCETDANPDMHGPPNEIVSVEAGETEGEYIIELNDAITVGEVTAIRFDNSGVGGTTTTVGYFSALPGDANGDGISTATDILALIDCINGVAVPTCREELCDIDRSDQCGPADILRLIDLLNGAGSYNAWYGVQLPSSDGLCP